MILFRKANPDRRVAEIAGALREAASTILEHDYLELSDAVIREVADNMRLIVSGSYNASARRLNKLLEETRRHLLPVTQPYTFLRMAHSLLEASRSEGLPLKSALERLNALSRVVLEYTAAARENIMLSLNYLVEPNSSLLVLGYTSFHVKSMLTIRNRLATVHTIYQRPYMPGRKLAAEVAQRGMPARSWPDTDLAHVMDMVNYVFLLSPGIDSGGIVALDPGSLATLALARELEVPVIVASEGLAFADETFANVMDRKVEVHSKTLNTRLSLNPFEYATVTQAETLVTESGTYHSPTMEMLDDIRRRVYATIVQEAVRLSR